MSHATRVLLAVLVTLTVQVSRTGADDLENLLEIGDEAFQPVTRPLSAPPFTHRKSIEIQTRSLTDGWVNNRQCHEHFAAMPSLQIVFKPSATRNIQISQTKQVGRAWVEGSTVQLEQAGPETVLCFSSQNRLLSQTGPGRYQLKVGPFYYRYLDGYFPMRMELGVTYPANLLRVVNVKPKDPAINIDQGVGQIRFESLFQGKLWITVLFAVVQDPLSKPR